MILLDVNTPRNSIEEAEFEEDDEIFEMDLDANTATAEGKILKLTNFVSSIQRFFSFALQMKMML